MNFFQVRKYTKFPFRNIQADELIQSFETLDQANAFSIAYNTKKNEKGKYIVKSNDGYYVCEIKNPSFK